MAVSEWWTKSWPSQTGFRNVAMTMLHWPPQSPDLSPTERQYSHHRCAADRSAATAWYYRVHVDQTVFSRCCCVHPYNLFLTSLKLSLPSKSSSTSLIMFLRPRWVCGAPSFSIISFSSIRSMKPSLPVSYLKEMNDFILQCGRLLPFLISDWRKDLGFFWWPSAVSGQLRGPSCWTKRGKWSFYYYCDSRLLFTHEPH